GYVSSADGSNFDEGSVTITQLQGLRAARNAGIPVPKETITRAMEYLEACTTTKGGVIYSYAGSGGAAAAGQERPPITAAAVACQSGYIGPVFSTSVNLTILQLEKGILPIYHK